MAHLAGTNLEYVLTHSQKDDWMIYIASQEEDFPELIHLSIADKQPYSWRASWLLSSCMENNDKRVRKYIKKIIDILPARPNNQQRALLKVLQKMELVQDYEAPIFNLCANIWKDIKNNPSLRFQAIKIMVAIAKKYPDLRHEIQLLTDTNYTDNLSDIIQKSIKKLITNDYTKHGL